MCKLFDSVQNTWLQLRLCFSCNSSCKSNLAKNYLIFKTNIFNTFPVAKIIQSNCILQSKEYVPPRSPWVNRVFTD